MDEQELTNNREVVMCMENCRCEDGYECTPCTEGRSDVIMEAIIKSLEAKNVELEKKWFQSNKERAYFEKKLEITVKAIKLAKSELELDCKYHGLSTLNGALAAINGGVV